jgi:hypothetical protein
MADGDCWKTVTSTPFKPVKDQVTGSFQYISDWWRLEPWNFLTVHILGISSSQLTNSYFSEGLVYHQPDFNGFMMSLGKEFDVNQTWFDMDGGVHIHGREKNTANINPYQSHTGSHRFFHECSIETTTFQDFVSRIS